MKLFLYSLLILTPCFSFGSSDYTTRSNYTNIHYNDSNKDVAAYIVKNIDSIIEELLDEFSSDLLPLVDINIYNDRLLFNAAADLNNEASTFLFQVPFTSNELIDNNNYILDTLRHELAHSLSARITSDLAAEWSKFYQFIFWAPNAAVPSGFQEGLAQVIESNYELETGRAYRNNSFYNGLWLSEWRNGFISFSDFSALHEIDGHLRAYLYGAFFFSYITQRFGDKAISEWLHKRSNDIYTLSNSLFNLNYSWQEAFNESITDSWEKFLMYENATLEALYIRETSATSINSNIGSYRNEPNISFYIDRNNKYYISPIKNHRKSSFGFYKNNKIIKTFNLPKALQVALIDDKSIYYLQYNECKGKQALDIVHFEIEKDKHQKITRCGKILAFDANANTIVILEKSGSGSTIKTIDMQSNETRIHWHGSFKQQISALKLSPSGRSVLLSLKPSLVGVWNLYILDLTNNNLKKITDDNFIQRSPSFINQSEIVYTRGYNGIEQVFHLNLSTGVESQVSNHNYAVLKPVVLGDELYTLSLAGLDVQLHVEPYNLLGTSQQFEASILSSINVNRNNKNEILSQPYRFIESFKLHGIIPMPSYSIEDGLSMDLLLFVGDAKREHLLTYQAKTAILTGTNSHFLSYKFKNEFGLELQNYKQDDSITNGYNIFYHNSRQMGSVNIMPVLNTTTLLTYKQGNIIEQQWLGGGLALTTLENCSALNATCDGWRTATFIENKNGFKSIDQENNMRIIAEAFFPSSYSTAIKIGLDTRFAFEENKFSLGQQNDHYLLEPLISSSFNQRGYDSPLQGKLVSQIDARATKQWAPSKSLGSIGLSLDTINLTPYFLSGFNYENSNQLTVGAEFRVQSTILWNIPIAFSTGYALGVDKDGNDEFYLTFGTNF